MEERSLTAEWHLVTLFPGFSPTRPYRVRERENFSRGENLGMRLGTWEKELTGYNLLVA